MTKFWLNGTQFVVVTITVPSLEPSALGPQGSSQLLLNWDKQHALVKLDFYPEKGMAK